MARHFSEGQSLSQHFSKRVSPQNYPKIQQLLEPFLVFPPAVEETVSEKFTHMMGRLLS